MAKNLAIFCDGTWNHLDAAEPTNVAILSKNVPPVTVGGVAQKAIYMPGVGAPRQEAGLVERALDRVTGGALGWGLDGKLKAAYREVARTYHARLLSRHRAGSKLLHAGHELLHDLKEKRS